MFYKVKNILFILLITLFLQEQNNAQSVCSQDSMYLAIEEPNLYGKLFVNPYIGNETQYHLPWLYGDITLTNGQVAKNEYLRYNGFLDEILWIRSTDYKTVIIERNSIESCVLYDKSGSVSAKYRKEDVKDIIWEFEDDVFMQVLAEGQVELLIYRKVAVIKYSDEIYYDFHYYTKTGETMTRFMPQRWKIYRILPQYKKELRSIIHKFHLNPKRSENDLILLFKELNSRISE